MLAHGVAADARTAVILGVKAEGVGIGLRHAEGLVPVARRVVADADLVVAVAAGVVLDDAEVIGRVVRLGLADELLELPGSALVGLLLAANLGGPPAAHHGSLLGDDRLAALLGRAGVFARKLEGVLDGVALLSGVAALGDLRVVAQVEEGAVGLAVCNPDVDDRDAGVAHALGHEIRFEDLVDVVLAEALGLSERSGVVLSEHAGSGAGKGVQHRETDVGGVLEGDLDRKFGVHR